MRFPKRFLIISIVALGIGGGAFLALSSSSDPLNDLVAAVKGNSEARARLGWPTARGEEEFIAGEKLLEKGDSLKAVALYRKAAEQGHALAQYSLGLLYFNGDGVPQDNLQAESWLLAAAKQGVTGAKAYLGRLYQSNGEEVKAAEWYRKAAEEGHVQAQWLLGEQYLTGTGVPQDGKQAAYWLRQAAEQGNAKSQSRLGIIYQYGSGVPQDPIQAYAWLSVGTANGDGEAKKFRNLVAQQLTSAQLAEAQAMANNYFEEYRSK